MSPVVKEEQREMARRNTVNEDREDEFECNGTVLVAAEDDDDDHDPHRGHLGDGEYPGQESPEHPGTLVRSASVPLDPKAERDEYDTRSVTSDILPEGQDEQPGCVIA